MDSPQKTILIIDDEPHIRRILEFKLKNAGYRILSAKNGEIGLEKILGEQPDAVISDINMPKIDGKTLCETTNDLKKERPFLTIIVTARIRPDDRCWAAGMKDTIFMEKPFSPSKILEHINAYFDEQKA